MHSGKLFGANAMTPRLIFADWLDERGEPELAGLFRG